MIEFKEESNKTDLPLALQYLTNAMKRHVTAFLISDFMDQNEGLEQAISIANNKHDVVALHIFDERETELPSIGMIKLKDAETGEYVWVDTSSSSVRKAYMYHWLNSKKRWKPF